MHVTATCVPRWMWELPRGLLSTQLNVSDVSMCIFTLIVCMCISFCMYTAEAQPESHEFICQEFSMAGESF